MLQMKVKVVGVDQSTMLPVVILTDDQEERYVPLVIGPAEANAIALVLEKVEVARPLTHDLFLNSILALGAKVDKAVLTDMADDVYYAELYLVQGKKTIKVDSRPSDAIALALRAGVPIFVDDKITTHALVSSPDDDPELEEFRSFLEDLSPDDFRKEN
ncbi:MAG: bifunctional nuclease family protein [Firmicutes bacterium]|nr:bifunctional nuclease family protein [Bacillota bacterium]